MQTRRAQQPITIRSDRAAERLRILTRDGRSQARVVEEALELMPEPRQPVRTRDEYFARIAEIQERARRDDIPSMAEFDAREYDADGNPR